MVLNTLTVGAAVTPTVLKTYGAHYLGGRKERQQKPTAHISYDEGLHLIRAFLQHASRHTVEELQAFTAQWVPSPRWVRTEEVAIPADAVTRAAEVLSAQLGAPGIERVGGATWWQWRRENRPLRAEWIEMRSEYNRRKKAAAPCRRVMLYVHGGAYFFGSVDEHRYQMQRHARKLKARVFAPRYRLAPQFPFPCGLHDCLAAYLHLLTMQEPSTILLAGDSAGGGMIMSLMVTLRDQGLPMPAGAILISPWVDLTHSFPSVAGSGDRDYIPDTGFFHRPSEAWPPPNAEEMKELTRTASGLQEGRAAVAASPREKRPVVSTSDLPADLTLQIDDQLVTIKDQIQMYTTNAMLAHPLVSPVLQPSLGGLPPLLIQVGGGEMLRDEQVYLAHKAANPAQYPAPETSLQDVPNGREQLAHYPPTDVQLQVWDDLCHVAPTLSFTRPAKFMYRSIAQFGAWALAHAQRTEIDILDDDDVSVISTGSDTGTESDEDSAEAPRRTKPQSSRAPQAAQSSPSKAGSAGVIGKAGDPLPPFKAHMIRQRIDRHGEVHPLDPAHTLEALQLAAHEIGTIKEGTVRKWLAAKKNWDHKYARERRAVQKRRARALAKGFRAFGQDEVPPPSALAGRISKDMPEDQKNKRSWGMSLWSLWGSSHDKETLEREEQLPPPGINVEGPDGGSFSPGRPPRTATALERMHSRSHVRDLGQAGGPNQDDAGAEAAAAADQSLPLVMRPSFVPVPQAAPTSGPTLVLPGTNVTLDSPHATRPKADGIAFPFKLGRLTDEDNASMVTLGSHQVATPGLESNEAPRAARP